MVVRGIGIDIIEIKRIQRLLEKNADGFLRRVFLPEEIEYCRSKKYPAQHYAARLAVKEAVFKAFGEGWTEKIGWKDILVKRARNGRPKIELLGKGKKLQEEMSVKSILVSLSHADDYSVAQALLLIDGDKYDYNFFSGEKILR